MCECRGAYQQRDTEAGPARHAAADEAALACGALAYLAKP